MTALGALAGWRIGILLGIIVIAIAAVIGVFVGTWMTGRNASINPAAVSLH